jgi:hypothetical protein
LETDRRSYPRGIECEGGSEAMRIEQIAQKLETEPQTLERESLKLYVEKKLRVIESELLRLAHKYDVQNVTELDEMIKQGKYHEDETFEDYFEFDNLESKRDTLISVLESL